ncbi:hypothetical protein [Actinoplanes flavus]|uniref:Uncharacterized protein n=1 Tax=Actinoplanes flavus TaxID=2820290 RepID=A0ABS3UVN5_9ACTN|nr:hypothetical protein [Actinoplanes flavus]MBO3742627.1 hypothetical protein [Actinoplanes flavus]
MLRPELGEQGAVTAYRAAQSIFDLGGAKFRRRELFAALTACCQDDPLPEIKALLG